MQVNPNRTARLYNPDGSLKISDHNPALAKLLGIRPKPGPLSIKVNNIGDLVDGLPLVGDSHGELRTNNHNRKLLKLLHERPEPSPDELIRGLRLVGTENNEMLELEKIVKAAHLFEGTKYEGHSVRNIIKQTNQYDLDERFITNVRNFLSKKKEPLLHRYKVAQLIEDIANMTGTYREIIEDITEQIPALEQELFEMEAAVRKAA